MAIQNPSADQIRRIAEGLGLRVDAEAVESYRSLVDRRDDLTVELAALYNQSGRPEEALALLENRIFHPWEGGEGKVAEQYVQAHLMRGRAALQANQLDASSVSIDSYIRAVIASIQNLEDGSDEDPEVGL